MKEKIKKIVLCTVIILAVLLICFVTAFALLFVSVNPKFEPAPLNGMDYFAGAKVTQQVLSHTLRSKNPDEIKVLKISSREMLSITRMLENGESILYFITGKKTRKDSSVKNDRYKVSYRDGRFYFKVRLNDPFCGLCMVAKGSAELSYEVGNMDIKILHLQIGRVEMPEKIKEKVKKRIYEYLENDDNYRKLRKVLIKIHHRDHGNVSIYYFPYRLREMFLK